MTTTASAADLIGRLRFRIVFDRIGHNRHTDLLTLNVTVDDGPIQAVAEQLADAIANHIVTPEGFSAPLLTTSAEIDFAFNHVGDRVLVSADLNGASGQLLSGGYRPAGNFTVTALPIDSEARS